MYSRIAITLPENLVKRLEKERKEINFSRSAYFKKAIETFLGLGSEVDDKLIKKYGPIYESMKEEDKKISNEMLSSAFETIPNE